MSPKGKYLSFNRMRIG